MLTRPVPTCCGDQAVIAMVGMKNAKQKMNNQGDRSTSTLKSGAGPRFAPRNIARMIATIEP